MAASPMNGHWSLRIPADLMDKLEAHLFPGDGDEHGAVIGAAVVTTGRGTRFLARRLILAQDGTDYIPGQRGYRMLTPSFVRDCALACAEEGLAYLAIHCHGGADQVCFSGADLASHERGYPALLDIIDGPPVGGLVFARNAVAGDIWLSDRSRVLLHDAEVVGRPIRRLFPAPVPRPSSTDERYDRQARVFGDRGQDLLARQKVGIIGAGGAGSLVIEYLARLGVGELIVIDPDRIEPSNLPRVVGSRWKDLRPFLTHPRMPDRIKTFGTKRRTLKVDIAKRVALQAQPSVRYVGIPNDVTEEAVAAQLVDCDYLVLAADTMQARLLFNALVHQYLIPGVQLGAKAQINPTTGEIIDIFSVVRPVIPGEGCLWCNSLISPAKLQEEATAPDQLRRQRYIEEDDLPAPSVITLNAVSAAHAVNDYLMGMLGLLESKDLRWVKIFPREGEVAIEVPRRDPDCPECSSRGRRGAGHLRPLPIRQNQARTSSR